MAREEKQKRKEQEEGRTTRIALLGHSQIPKELKVEGCEIKIFRHPGAEIIETFRSLPLELTENSFHWILVWLGSNDIKDSVDLDELFLYLKQLVFILGQKCKAEVCVVAVEPRKRFRKKDGLTLTRYNRIRSGLNKRIVRTFKPELVTHFNDKVFQEGLARDGVHFNEETQKLVVQKLVRQITRVRDIRSHAGRRVYHRVLNFSRQSEIKQVKREKRRFKSFCQKLEAKRLKKE